jgi:hypothetical protein
MDLIDTLRRKTYGSAQLRWARWNMERSGLNEMLRNRPSDAIVPQGYDLWNLYREIRRFKPQKVLEFGIGCSTLVMAEALRRNGSGHLYTVEGSQHWLDVTRRDLTPGQAKYATLIRSDCEVIDMEGERAHRFVTLPDGPFDMIYLDGPNAPEVPGWGADELAAAADPILLEESLSSYARIVVDGRARNVTLLKRHLKRRYRVKTHRLFKVTTFAAI